MSPKPHDVEQKPPSQGRGCRRRRRRIGASVLYQRFGPILRASPSSFLRKEPYVTGFTLVSPVLHDEVQKPPSQGRGCRRRRRRIGASVLYQRFGPILRASPSSFLRKEPYVTGFTLVSPVLHDEVQKPPSQGRGCRRRRRRIGASVLYQRFGPILRASPSSFLRKEPTLRDLPLCHYCRMT